jgi:hypothetical protein
VRHALAWVEAATAMPSRDAARLSRSFRLVYRILAHVLCEH